MKFEGKERSMCLHFMHAATSSTYLDIYPLSEEVEKLRNKIRPVYLNTINDLSLNAFDHNCLQWELQFTVC